MKQCILSESRFDFLKDLVKNIPDASAQEDNENNAIFEANLHKLDEPDDMKTAPLSPIAMDLSKPATPANFYTEQSTSTSRTPVIQYGPKVAQCETPKLNFSVNSLIEKSNISITLAEPVPVPPLVPSVGKPILNKVQENNSPPVPNGDNIPPLVPISHSFYGHSNEDNLCIDEDYDN